MIYKVHLKEPVLHYLKGVCRLTTQPFSAKAEAIFL
jgi:hypothetical protein